MAIFLIADAFYIVWAVLVVPAQGATENRRAIYGIYAAGAVGGLLVMLRLRQNKHVVFGDALRAPAPTFPVAPAVRNYLAERAVILSTLSLRAAYEGYAQSQSGNGPAAAIPRQAQNALLREAGVWEKLEPQERELVSFPEGGWSHEQYNMAAIWCEQVRLLRWVLGMDDVLLPLALFPEPDLALARGLGEPPGDAATRESWEVRIVRDEAAAYLGRLIGEQRSRGWAGLQSDESTAQWADQVRKQHLGDSSDYLVGAKTVAELDDQTLMQFSVTVLARWRYASYLMEQLSMDRPMTAVEFADRNRAS